MRDRIADQANSVLSSKLAARDREVAELRRKLEAQTNRSDVFEMATKALDEQRKALLEVVGAAREVDAFLGGVGPGGWRYCDQPIPDDGAEPLLSMHDYLNHLPRELGGPGAAA